MIQSLVDRKKRTVRSGGRLPQSLKIGMATESRFVKTEGVGREQGHRGQDFGFFRQRQGKEGGKNRQNPCGNCIQIPPVGRSDKIPKEMQTKGVVSVGTTAANLFCIGLPFWVKSRKQKGKFFGDGCIKIIFFHKKDLPGAMYAPGRQNRSFRKNPSNQAEEYHQRAGGKKTQDKESHPGQNQP